MTLNIKRSKVSHINMSQLPASPKFHSILLYSQTFLIYKPFWAGEIKQTTRSPAVHCLASVWWSQTGKKDMTWVTPRVTSSLQQSASNGWKKWPWTQNGQRYLLHKYPKFHYSISHKILAIFHFPIGHNVKLQILIFKMLIWRLWGLSQRTFRKSKVERIISVMIRRSGILILSLPD